MIIKAILPSSVHEGNPSFQLPKPCSMFVKAFQLKVKTHQEITARIHGVIYQSQTQLSSMIINAILPSSVYKGNSAIQLTKPCSMFIKAVQPNLIQVPRTRRHHVYKAKMG